MNSRLASKLAIMVAGFALASIALAQAPQQQQPAQGGSTPKGWNYQLDKNGNRIPKGNRVTNPDGSWREEIRQGKCMTVKEMSAKGEYRETHTCG
jgi:hypothetical protein